MRRLKAKSGAKAKEKKTNEGRTNEGKTNESKTNEGNTEKLNEAIAIMENEFVKTKRELEEFEVGLKEAEKVLEEWTAAFTKVVEGTSEEAEEFK